ncbi:MAG: ATP-binding cassette domain-containing protein, partial [Alphaproteobacteria bacterium]|nr:ATP-binding cassette domain-containing protein [Alphaproteobacteria bacterium]
MLKLVDVHAGYGAIPVLRDVNIEVNEGEIITLIGANGAGKTTTLMAICGLVRARSGDILLEGESICGLPTNRIVEMGVCQVPEGRLIFPDLTV